MCPQRVADAYLRSFTGSVILKEQVYEIYLQHARSKGVSYVARHVFGRWIFQVSAYISWFVCWRWSRKETHIFFDTKKMRVDFFHISALTFIYLSQSFLKRLRREKAERVNRDTTTLAFV